jgi:hypothetical protein
VNGEPRSTDRTFPERGSFRPPEDERSNGPDDASTFLVLAVLRQSGLEVAMAALRVPASAGSWVSNLKSPHPVARVRALTALKDEIEALRDAAVDEARAMRPKAATWEEIGRATGLKKTSAQARWGGRK